MQQSVTAAIRAFLDRLVHERAADPDGLRARIDRLLDNFKAEWIPAKANGQVLSVGARFALLHAAAELARSWGVLPWPEREAMRAIGACFSTWLDERGGT